VFVGQVEEGVVVIEVRFLPGRRLMATGAFGSEEAAMSVVPRMAPITGRRSLAKGLTGLVTTRASERHVCALEREVGQIVGKPGLAQPCDIGVSTEVLGMAAPALTGCHLPDVAVVATLAADVRRDLLVAAQAETALALATGEVVALGALGFEPGVCRGDRARHDELFDARGMGDRAA
jgi:hypothetical protein